MALLFMDGWDHYATADLAASYKWTRQGSNSSSATIDAAAGRRGGGGLKITAGSCYLSRTFSNTQTWIIGFALNFTSIPTQSTFIVLNTSANQISLRMNSSGYLQAVRGYGASPVVLGTASAPLSSNTWGYIETKVKVANSGGTFDIHLNGTSVLSLTGQDTSTDANDYAYQFILGQVDNYTITMYLDDLYVCDNSGTTNNDFLGDSRVDTYFPNGNGNYSQFVGSDSDSTDNYLHVDDATPDGDSTYVQSSTVTGIDTYNLTNITHSPSSIFGVQAVSTSKKDDSGSRSIALSCRSNSTDYSGSSNSLSTSYAAYPQLWETDPNTSSAWTISGFNAAEFGVKVSA